ncbi:uncharacterized protein [Aristolochia californica]|uniref:uncharacterized protein n=1 Tax=Aristolochia californica TaxID=171875 RepID=UPI0035DE051D
MGDTLSNEEIQITIQKIEDSLETAQPVLGMVCGLEEEMSRVFSMITELRQRDIRIQSSKVSLFIVGLNEYLRLEVELLMPTDLVHAMNMALAMEQRKQLQQRKLGWSGDRNTSSTWQGHRYTWQGHRYTSSQGASPVAPSRHTPTTTQYRVRHLCRRIFWLEVEDSEDPEDIIEEEPPEISLHAITGQKLPNTIQVRAHDIDRELVGLVGSGSPIHTHLTATVSVANGKKVPSYGTSKAVTFFIGSISFDAEFFVIPLAGFDMTQEQPDSTSDDLLEEFSDLFQEPSGSGGTTVPLPTPSKGQDRASMLGDVEIGSYSSQSLPVLFTCLTCEETIWDMEVLRGLSGVEQADSKRQVLMHPSDIEKTAFRTHLGHFEFVIMPFSVLLWLHMWGIWDTLSHMRGLRLLKKNSFIWNEEATKSFAALKVALASVPVLQLPNFDELQLTVRHHKLAAYEHELIGLAKAVQHWRPYLLGRAFLIHKDHYSLKFLLEQHLMMLPQQHWINKLLGFDFSVEYRVDRLNKVADALSWCFEDPQLVYSISQQRFLILDLVRDAHATDPALQELHQKISEGTMNSKWSIQNSLIYYKKWIFLPLESELVPAILSAYHDNTHERIQKTLHRIRADFYWQAMKPSIATYVWADILMDFVEGLPLSSDKSVLFMVVDRLSNNTSCSDFPGADSPLTWHSRIHYRRADRGGEPHHRDVFTVLGGGSSTAMGSVASLG